VDDPAPRQLASDDEQALLARAAVRSRRRDELEQRVGAVKPTLDALSHGTHRPVIPEIGFGCGTVLAQAASIPPRAASIMSVN
jgi:tRNA G46 methylase TrmB